MFCDIYFSHKNKTAPFNVVKMKIFKVFEDQEIIIEEGNGIFGRYL